MINAHHHCHGCNTIHNSGRSIWSSWFRSGFTILLSRAGERNISTPITFASTGDNRSIVIGGSNRSKLRTCPGGFYSTILALTCWSSLSFSSSTTTAALISSSRTAAPQVSSSRRYLSDRIWFGAQNHHRNHHLVPFVDTIIMAKKARLTSNSAKAGSNHKEDENEENDQVKRKLRGKPAATADALTNETKKDDISDKEEEEEEGVNHKSLKAIRKRVVTATHSSAPTDALDSAEEPTPPNSSSNKKEEPDPTATAAGKPRATRKRKVAVTTVVVDTSIQVSTKKDEPPDLAEQEDAKPKATRKRNSSTSNVVQNITVRDELVKSWNAEEAFKLNGSYTFKVASWNVAGLRALLRNAPNALIDLLRQHDLDVLCLQETKLQESHLEEPQLVQFRDQLSEHGYQIYYSCSTERKGYSGTAVMVRRGKNMPTVTVSQNGSSQPDEPAPSKKKSKKQTNLKNFFGSKKNDDEDNNDKNAPKTGIADSIHGPPKSNLPEFVQRLFDSTKISYGIGHAQHDGEGRVIVLDFPLFSLCNVYIPNSGDGLKRLSYGVDQWDRDFLTFVQQHSKQRQVPMLWLGDLNIAHQALDVYNDGAKHLLKQAGVTPQERASFSQQLADSGFADVFRHLYPTARGHYTYWSTRAGNRDANKGLRLDYFVCDPVLLQPDQSNVVVRDSYMLHEVKGSDHCPIVLEMEIKASKQASSEP